MWYDLINLERELFEWIFFRLGYGIKRIYFVRNVARNLYSVDELSVCLCFKNGKKSLLRV